MTQAIVEFLAELFDFFLRSLLVVLKALPLAAAIKILFFMGWQ